MAIKRYFCDIWKDGICCAGWRYDEGATCGGWDNAEDADSCCERVLKEKEQEDKRVKMQAAKWTLEHPGKDFPVLNEKLTKITLRAVDQINKSREKFLAEQIFPNVCDGSKPYYLILQGIGENNPRKYYCQCCDKFLGEFVYSVNFVDASPSTTTEESARE